MSNTGTKVVKNASFLLISQVATWTFTLVLTVFLGRYLGAEQGGEYTIAYSIWTIVGVFITFGMDTLLTKEIARAPERTSELLGTSIVARVLLYICSWGIVALYIYLRQFSAHMTILIGIVGIAQLFMQLYAATQAAFQGLELMQYISISSIASRLANTVLGITVLVLGYGVYGYAIITIVTVLTGLLLQLFYMRRYYTFKLGFNRHEMWKIMRAGLPYLVSGLGLVAYGQVDVLIISSLVDTTQVGWYGYASRLFSTFMFFPVIFSAAVFPALTRTYTSASNSLPTIMRKSFDLMLVLSIPIGLGLLVVANQLAVLLYGPDLAQVGPILGLMGIVLIPTYQNILLGQFLTSTDRQNAWTIVIIVATVLTIPLDILLVPWCQRIFGNGAMAGSLSFLITELGMVAVGIALLPKGSLSLANVGIGVRVLCAGLAMAAGAWWVRNLFIVVPVFVGAAIYIALILALRVLPSEDIALLKQFGQRGMQRLRRRGDAPATIEGV